MTTLLRMDYEKALREATVAERRARAEFERCAEVRRKLIVAALDARVPRGRVEHWADVGRERVYAIERMERERRRKEQEQRDAQTGGA